VIIVIGGLVGAGKTSLAKELNKYYIHLNRSVCVLRLTAYPNTSYLLFDLLARIFYGHKVVQRYEKVGVHPSTLVAKRVQGFSSLFANIIIFVEILSLFLWNLCTKLRCFMSQIIIIDEGFVNAVANYLEILGKSATTLISFILRWVQRWNQQHKVVFLFITADFITLIRRWTTRRRPIITSLINIDHHIRYLRLMLLSLKLFLNSGFNVKIFDSSGKDVHMLVHEVIKYVEGSICR
jgi:RNase adaptor protein for sRNA GlmZ degradation